MTKKQTGTKAIVKNTILLYARMLIVLLVSLYISRILLQSLGVEGYGIYNVVGGITTLFSFMTAAMSIATQRFLTFELGKGNVIQMQEIYCVSLLIHVIIICLFLVLSETLGLWILYDFIDIPPEKENVAFGVYQFAILTMCVNICVIPFNATIITYEKMAVYAIISIIDIVLKLLVAFSIQYASCEKISFYAAMLLLESIVVLLINYLYCKKHFEIIQFRFKLAKNRFLFKQLFSFTGWNFLGQSSMAFSNQGINIVLNMFFGVAINAAMGITMQVNGALMNLIYNFQTAFRPQLTKLYAQNAKDDIQFLIYFATKVSFFLLFIVMLPLVFNINYVLELWLGEVPLHTSKFCVLMLIYSLTEAITGPLFITINASGKIRTYQIYVSIILVLNIILSYILLNFGYAPEIVFYVKILINIFLLIYRVYYCNTMISINVRKYVNTVLLKLLSATVMPVLIMLILNERYISSFIPSILTAISLVTISMYYIGLNKNERKLIIENVWQKLFQKKS